MYAASADLIAALDGPGVDKFRAYAELWQGTPKAKVATVELSGGQVVWDRTASTRGSCQVTIPTLDSLVPDNPVTGTDRLFGDGTFGSGLFGDYRRRYLRGTLLPLLTEIRIFWEGLLPGTDTWESVPLGRFTVTAPVFNDQPGGGQSVQVTGYDCSTDIASALWQQAFTIAKGTNIATGLTALLQNRLPGLVLHTPATTLVTPQLVYTPGGQNGNTPWQDAQTLALSAGWSLYINRAGEAVAAPLPSTLGTPQYTLADTANALRFQQSPSAADLANTIIVYGENSANKPFSVTVQDTTGPYGTTSLGRTVAKEYRSSTVTTSAQATIVGNHLLQKSACMTETVQMDVMPSPHRDPDDVAAVVSEFLELEDAAYGVDRVEFNLDGANAASKITVSRSI